MGNEYQEPKLAFLKRPAALVNLESVGMSRADKPVESAIGHARRYLMCRPGIKHMWLRVV